MPPLLPALLASRAASELEITRRVLGTVEGNVSVGVLWQKSVETLRNVQVEVVTPLAASRSYTHHGEGIPVIWRDI